MEAAAREAQRMNRQHPRLPGEPSVAHYAGSPPEETRRLCQEFIARWTTGNLQFGLRPATCALREQEQAPTGAEAFPPRASASLRAAGRESQAAFFRWGIRTVWMAANAEERAQWHRLFPGSQWIVCLRDPVATFRSLRQTFCPEMTPEEFARRWHEVQRFLHSEPQRCWHFDLDRWRQASPQERRRWTEELLHWLHLEPEEPVLQAAAQFPPVNQALPAHQRPYVSELDLEQVRKLCR